MVRERLPPLGKAFDSRSKARRTIRLQARPPGLGLSLRASSCCPPNSRSMVSTNVATSCHCLPPWRRGADGAFTTTSPALGNTAAAGRGSRRGASASTRPSPTDSWSTPASHTPPERGSRRGPGLNGNALNQSRTQHLRHQNPGRLPRHRRPPRRVPQLRQVQPRRRGGPSVEPSAGTSARDPIHARPGRPPRKCWRRGERTRVRWAWGSARMSRDPRRAGLASCRTQRSIRSCR